MFTSKPFQFICATFLSCVGWRVCVRACVRKRIREKERRDKILSFIHAPTAISFFSLSHGLKE